MPQLPFFTILCEDGRVRASARPNRADAVCVFLNDSVEDVQALNVFVAVHSDEILDDHIHFNNLTEN